MYGHTSIVAAFERIYPEMLCRETYDEWILEVDNWSVKFKAIQSYCGGMLITCQPAPPADFESLIEIVVKHGGYSQMFTTADLGNKWTKLAEGLYFRDYFLEGFWDGKDIPHRLS